MCPSDDIPILDDVAAGGGGGQNWKVLIVDDDADVHAVTRMALHGFEFGERGLAFLSAFTAEEARQMVLANPDAAVMFLDVVMETEQAGLDLVQYIRRQAANDQLRIVLRTGQPGQAPEQRVVRDYDINDYREKTELTAQKLNTLMYATLRSFRDIVRLKAQSEELRRAEERAQAGSRAKSAFLANISHEFRTPLNGIIGLAQMMSDEVLGPIGHPKYREYSWDIRSSGENLMTKIESVLEIAEHADDGAPLNDDEFDLVALIGECLHSLKDDVAAELTRREGGEDSRIVLRADKRYVRRMIMNLLSNALKYNTEQGEVRVAARVLAQGDLVVSVIDSGVGIPEDVVRRLGEPFTVEGEAYLWSKRGVGLGLAITKRLIERHRGRLEIDSVPGNGTTVRLVFPRERVIAARRAH